MRLLLVWLLNAFALLIVPEIVTSIQVRGYGAALIAALLLGLVNTLIKPILLILTLPITIITFGLFALIINALLFWLVANMLSGFSVPSFWSAFWGALVYSILTGLVSLAIGK